MATERAVPFYCPYCGDEDVRPLTDTHGTWWCQSCRRAWALKMLGIGTPDEIASTASGDE